MAVFFSSLIFFCGFNGQSVEIVCSSSSSSPGYEVETENIQQAQRKPPVQETLTVGSSCVSGDSSVMTSFVQSDFDASCLLILSNVKCLPTKLKSESSFGNICDSSLTDGRFTLKKTAENISNASIQGDSMKEVNCSNLLEPFAAQNACRQFTS